MPITPEQVDQRLEFKEAQQQFDYKKACQYCVAIANEGGGKLIFGVSGKPPRQVVGTQACADVVRQPQKLFETLASTSGSQTQIP